MGGAKQGKLGHPLMIEDAIIQPATLKMPPLNASVLCIGISLFSWPSNNLINYIKMEKLVPLTEV